MSKDRCPWCGDDELYRSYHDEEWGVPLFDDLRLFEFLILETMQAGLSWLTILRKREGFRRALDRFSPEKMARFGNRKVEQLLQDSSIIRNRKKIEGAIRNAKSYLQLLENGVSFSDYLWSFVDGQPIVNTFRKMDQVPASTPLSLKMSKDMKKRGFVFVGPTIVYAHMQATGMVNDHLVSCFRYREISGD